jgi:hypothetical protein
MPDTKKLLELYRKFNAAYRGGIHEYHLKRAEFLRERVRELMKDPSMTTVAATKKAEREWYSLPENELQKPVKKRRHPLKPFSLKRKASPAKHTRKRRIV